MNVCIKGNSISIRLSQPEVEMFGKEGYLEERVEFGDNIAFVYALARYHTYVSITADYTDNKLTILVPASIVEEWVSAEEISYSDSMDIGDGKKLALSIETGFEYTDNEGDEDQL